MEPDDQHQPVSSPAPLILLQPAPEGTLIDAYGYELPEMIDELRRALLHLVARQSGVTIISELVPRQAAVVATPVPAPKPKTHAPNGTGPKLKKRHSSSYYMDEDDDMKPHLSPEQHAALLQQPAW